MHRASVCDPRHPGGQSRCGVAFINIKGDSMATVIQAFILCATDNPAEANRAVFELLNGASFDSAHPILDFATGVEQMLPVARDYIDGEFVRQVPAAAFLKPANAAILPH